MGTNLGGGHLILGIGTEERGDDAAGLLAARLLRESDLPDTVRVQSLCGDGVTLMHAWENADSVTIIDAVDATLPPGTILTIDPWKQPPPSRVFVSSHLFGLAEAMQISMSFGDFPRIAVIYGIQGGTFRMNARITPPVLDAVHEVVRRILRETGAHSRPVRQEGAIS